MIALALVTALGCDSSGTGEDAGADPDAGEECMRFDDPQAAPGDDIDGDTYASFAQPFFESYCTRCHSSTNTVPERNGAPPGFDWDDEATVRMHLSAIRSAVGVVQFMPPSAPEPTCQERQRLVRWIDAAAP